MNGAKSCSKGEKTANLIRLAYSRDATIFTGGLATGHMNQGGFQ